MIKAVVFDFGGVLSRFGGLRDSGMRLAQVLGCDSDTVDIKLARLIGEWYTGRCETPEFWRQAARLVGAPEADYDAKWRASEPRVFEHAYFDLARILRERGLITGILSNVNPTSERLIRAAGGYRGFAPVILSCEVNLQKPDPAIFRLLLDKLGMRGPEVVFVDDIPQNVSAARALDLRAVQAGDPASTVARILKELDAQHKEPARGRVLRLS